MADIDYQLVQRREAETILGVSATTLKKWRLGDRQNPPALKDGVHWFRPSGGLVLYNTTLIRDWIANPHSHQIAIEAFLESLPSSQAAQT